ncbi:unnamed protein product [Rotaria sordida]|uniref:G-protein coupled receptors family 1 profile domain-containing protein n=1 Tax=Rotaria sordida TaxID=392033 RepID=A0A813VFI9_9BILA|nr:unnamed protein product [Rotaria sordida]CAF0875861.1 unnamed protein product [Rotaria sordida]
MASSTTDTNLIELLTNISEQLNRYLSSIIFIFGTVGNILNCLVLCQRRLRSNPCVALFLLSSFVSLISILIGLPTRILASWYLDPTATINWICKLRVFIVFSTRTMSIWLITLATIDRWLLSSINMYYRRMSTLKNVKQGMIICFILSIISHIHMFYCYEANVLDGPLPCYSKTIKCRLVTDLIYIFISIIIPLILIIIFGLMTVSNAHRVRTRVPHMIKLLNKFQRHGHKQLKSRIDHCLLRMLLVQIFILILCCIPQAIEKLYIIFHPFSSGSKLENVIKIFIYNIVLLLAFIQNGIPFYIHTLIGGTIFRKAFMDFVRIVNQRITF